jgi:hypothetical protein
MAEIQIVQIVAFMRLANRMHGDAKGDVPGDGHMISVSLDIFRKDAQGNPIWIGSTQDMDDARVSSEQTGLGASRGIFRIRSANPPSRRERRWVRCGPTPLECPL